MQTLKLIFTLFLTFPMLVKSFSLDNSGYYKLVVAIDEKTLQNSILEYVDNIKKAIQDLSEALHKSTNSKFSIKEVDIVVPSHWEVASDGVATTKNYASSDIKISHVHHLPRVDNPKPCSSPGAAIELPYNFFDNPDSGIFGNIGKALLTQFVRWRFGAWEEHGYPGDSVFPYYWKELLDETNWEVSACTDTKLVGDFKSIDDESDCSPTPGDIYPPPSHCRFYPLDEQTATSSLMSYHYLPTIEKFCDSTTHNKKQPTPQNYFCKHKSIMEVIESSTDWTQTTQPNTPNPVVFNVLKTSTSPLLYILLDSGMSQAPPSVLSDLATSLKNFTGDGELSNVVAAVGKYPADNEGQLLTEIVPWTAFKDGYAQFSEAFDNTFGKKPGFRNFAGALKEAVYQVNERQPAKGGVVLIIKTGIETDIANLTPESDVLMKALVAKQKVFAIEVQGSAIQPGILLKNVVTKTEGTHLALNSSSDINEQIDQFMGVLKTTLQTEVQTTRNRVYAIRDIIPNAGPVELKLNSGLKFFEAFAIPLRGTISSLKFKYVPGGDGNVVDQSLVELKQWESSSNPTKVFYGAPNNDYASPYPKIFWDEFEYTCAAGEDCQVLVTVLVKVVSMEELPTDITLSVTTSADETVVDMDLENAASDANTPFAIYAKLEQDGVPLTFTPGLEIDAFITHLDTSTMYKLRLTDDGQAVPDISLNDGVFSGTFVPLLEGQHSIFVTAKYHVPPPPLQLQTENVSSMWSQSAGKLFPTDQNIIGCGSGHLGCWTKEPSVDFVLTRDLPNFIEFKNVDKYSPMAHRIMDFSVTPSNQNNITLEWSAPGVITSDGLIKADSYEIKHSPDFDQLLLDFDNAADLFSPNDTPTPEDPGRLQSVTVDFGQEADQYFAIRARTSLSGNNAPPPVTSIIVGVNIRNTVVPTTTTTTTTISPVTSTTTMKPTEDVGGTGTGQTTPVMTSSVVTESTTSTPQRTSKPASTTTPTTTVKPITRPTYTPLPTSTEPPPKHWFQTTEGIITIVVFGGGVLLLIISGLVVLRIKRTLFYSRFS